MSADADVFICYNHKDREEVHQIVSIIKNNCKVGVWFDEEDAHKKTGWIAQVEEKLRKSKIFLIIYGPSGLGEYQKIERDAAIELNKQNNNTPIIVGIALQATKKESIPTFAYHYPIIFKENDSAFVAELKKTCDLVKSPRNKSLHHYWDGGILYCNFDKFSMAKIGTQEKMTLFLQHHVESFLRNVPYDKYVDLREGEALIFLRKPDDINQRDVLRRLLFFGLGLQLSASTNEFFIGITLHTGRDAVFLAVGGSKTLTGVSLSEARRYMSFSNGRHFLISSDAHKILEHDLHPSSTAKSNFADLFGDEFSKFPDYPKLEGEFDCKEFVFHDRHRRKVSLHNLSFQKQDCMIGDPNLPNYLVAIEFRDRSRELKRGQVFIERLIAADSVFLIGLTGELTKDFLKFAHEERLKENKSFWNSISIIFPSEDTIRRIHEPRPIEERIKKWQDGRRTTFSYLYSLGPEHLDKWKCLEFDGNLPFTGDQIVDNGISSIRISPVLPGTDMRKSYNTEIFQDTPAFDLLSQSFEEIRKHSKPYVEWIVHGDFDIDTKRLKYAGVVRLEEISNLEQNRQRIICQPIALVILHGRKSGQKKIYLQKRTEFNSTSDIGKYSNIAGRVTDKDLIDSFKNKFPKAKIAKIIHESDNYIKLPSDGYTEKLMAELELGSNKYLPDEMWKLAAQREIQEELGLIVDVSRLIHHTNIYHQRQDRQSAQLFHIFSLELKLDNDPEINQIVKFRPNASLEPFTLADIENLWKTNQLNSLLQVHLKDLFIPIYQQIIGIQD